MEFIIPILIATAFAIWVRKGAISRKWYDAQAQKLIKLPDGRRQLVFRSLASYNKTTDAGFDTFMYLKLLFARTQTTAATSLMDLSSGDGFEIRNRLIMSTRCWFVGDDKQNWISALTCESYCMPLWWAPEKKPSLIAEFLYLLGIKSTYGYKFMPKPRGFFTTEEDLTFLLNPENWKLIVFEKKSHAQRLLTTIEIARQWQQEQASGEFILTTPEQLDLSALRDLSQRMDAVKVDWSAKETSRLLLATGIAEFRNK